ncbi:uncharacterized protein LOC115623405 [Scaptodrosophila lebanonensis]|uniref:Uncharacterized protein LOC115623405 n=1 Tax=Drosophila lebanonensis TaxID=7225 RepID=A0A6J2TC29_DROLE|nr:uncharacterized protein LOC115623405 [Scaptodrosophila lebanonensis]
MCSLGPGPGKCLEPPPEIPQEIEPISPTRFLDLPKPKKIKIFDCDESRDEEELACKPSTELSLGESSQSAYVRELDYDDIKLEMEAIKERVGVIDKRLMLNIPECPDLDPCQDIELELQTDAQTYAEILQLQRDNYKLKHQMEQLKLCCYATDVTLGKMEAMVCQEQLEAKQLQRSLDKLESAKLLLERQFGLCSHRFRHLEQEKYQWSTCHSYFDGLRAEAERQANKCVSKEQIVQQRDFALETLNIKKWRLKRIHGYMSDCFKKLAAQMDMLLPQQSTVIVNFLQRNEKLFKRKQPKRDLK